MAQMVEISFIIDRPQVGQQSLLPFSYDVVLIHKLQKYLQKFLTLKPVNCLTQSFTKLLIF